MKKINRIARLNIKASLWLNSAKRAQAESRLRSCNMNLALAGIGVLKNGDKIIAQGLYKTPESVIKWLHESGDSNSQARISGPAK